MGSSLRLDSTIPTSPTSKKQTRTTRLKMMKQTMVLMCVLATVLAGEYDHHGNNYKGHGSYATSYVYTSPTYTHHYGGYDHHRYAGYPAADGPPYGAYHPYVHHYVPSYGYKTYIGYENAKYD